MEVTHDLSDWRWRCHNRGKTENNKKHTYVWPIITTFMKLRYDRSKVLNEPHGSNSTGKLKAEKLRTRRRTTSQTQAFPSHSHSWQWDHQAVSFQKLPAFMKHGEPLNCLILKARVFFPSALPESAAQCFTDFVRGRCDRNCFCK